MNLEALGFPQSYVFHWSERDGQPAVVALHALSRREPDGPQGAPHDQGWLGWTALSRSQLRDLDPFGQLHYSTTFTNGPDPRGAVVSGAAPYLSFASFLLGLPTSGSQQYTDATSLQFLYSAFYLQDDFKVTRKLTLNLGLRWDVETGPTERYNRQTWFDPAAANPLSQATGLPFLGSIEFASNSGNPRQRWETDANNFGPRVGFAWQATQKTVVRGGYGIIFLPTIQRIFISGNPGFAVVNRLCGHARWSHSRGQPLQPVSVRIEPASRGPPMAP